MTRLRLEGTPEELRKAAPDLLARLGAALEPHAPEASQALQKAADACSAPVEPKDQVLRDLLAETRRLYAVQTKKMLAEVYALLDQRVDELGGLSKAFGQQQAGHKYLHREFHHGHWVYTYAEKHGGKVDPHPTEPGKLALKVAAEHHQALRDLKVRHQLQGEVLEGAKFATLPMTSTEAHRIHAAENPPAMPPRNLLNIIQNDDALTEVQKALPVSKELRAAFQLDPGSPESWELPAGARVDPWEPQPVPPTAKWSHPDYGSGTGPAPWQQGTDWRPDLSRYDSILVNSSGGKDSQAMLTHVVTLCQQQGVPLSKVTVVHADLGRVEWEGTKELAQKQAEHYGVRFEVVRREGPDLVDQIEARHGDLAQRAADAAQLAAAGIQTWADLAGPPAPQRPVDGTKKDIAAHLKAVKAWRSQPDVQAHVARVRQALGEGQGTSQWDAGYRAEALVDKARAAVEAAAEWVPRMAAYQAALEQHAKDAAAWTGGKRGAPKAPKLKGEPVFATDAVDFGKPIAWPDSSSRYCTSDFKRDVIKKLMTRLSEEHRAAHGSGAKLRLLNCLGMRAQESSGRAKLQAFDRNEDTTVRTVDDWCPIHLWPEEKVWKTIAKSGLPFHKAYALGMRRLSCVFCVFADKGDLLVAAKHNPDLFKTYLELEEKVGTSFKASLSLADVAQEIQDRRAAGMELDAKQQWIQKAMGTWGLDQLAAELEKPEAGLLTALLTTALGHLGTGVQTVVLDWKPSGLCVHLDTHADSHHVVGLAYPEAYGASLAAVLFAQQHGLSLEENNAPSPLEDSAELDIPVQTEDNPEMEKSGPFIGPRGGKWADAKHTVAWREDGKHPDHGTTLRPAHGIHAFFASGSNHVGEIHGLLNAGHPVGVAIQELNAGAIKALEAQGPHGGSPVFVDSGAFSEVDFPPNSPPVVARPIDDATWEKRLGVMSRLGTSLRTRAYLVAPDCVGNQTVTLERLARYAGVVRGWKEHRANVIVPVQKGAMSMTAFRHAATRTMLTDDVVWGVPLKKDATRLEEVKAFAADLTKEGVEAPRLHLLGMGPQSPGYERTVAAIREVAPGARITADSVRIKAMSGTANGPARAFAKKGPRLLTELRAHTVEEGRLTGAADIKEHGVTTSFWALNHQELQGARRAGWYDDELESAPGVPLPDSQMDYGPGGPFGQDASYRPPEPPTRANPAGMLAYLFLENQAGHPVHHLEDAMVAHFGVTPEVARAAIATYPPPKRTK